MTIVKELNSLSEKVTGKNAKAFTDAQAVKFIADNYEGGGSEPYVLPVASAETLGGIKVGNNLSITEEGVLSAGASEKNTGLKIIDLANYQYGEVYLEGLTKGIYIITEDGYMKNSFKVKLSSTDTTRHEIRIDNPVLYIPIDVTSDLAVDSVVAYYFEYLDTGTPSRTRFQKSSSNVDAGHLKKTGSTGGTSLVTASSDQTITGKKTFYAIPEIKNTLTPTTDYQLVNKKYVDDAIAAALGQNNN